MSMDLSLPGSHLPMVGPQYARRLKKLGIETITDLLLHLPSRYQDFSLVSPIDSVKAGETVTIQGQIISSQNVFTRWGKKIQKVLISDASGQIEAVWFNQPYLTATLKAGLSIFLSGKIGRFGAHLTMMSPEYEILKPTTNDQQQTIHTGRLVPIYPETSGISSKWLRSRIAPLLSALPATDYLPSKVKTQNNLMDWYDSIRTAHFPSAMNQVPPAVHRLAFDELLFLHLATLIRKQKFQKLKLAHTLYIDQEKVLQFIARLPFTLTHAQNQAIKDILRDLNAPHPMNRLLEGDVGSGKTVVAAVVIYVNFLNGWQSALMAPTQILAHQHEATLRSLLEPLGVQVKLITSSTKKLDAKRSRPERNRRDSLVANVLVGTHALLHHPQLFTKLGLVVIDEQHRFGVEQRAALIKPSNLTMPHLLTMTATPIPRTIGLTLYGHLDVSYLDEMPQGRLPVKTWVVPPQKRAAAYKWISDQVKSHHHQAFIVCPLIEASPTESLAQVKAATMEYERLKQTVFPHLKLDLLHGKLKAEDKNQAIHNFALGKTDILISTPVVEVGIDIPQATIMLIEAAERFGLSQLHQLRGRVGRRHQQGYCLLFSESKNPPVVNRLQALEKEISGLKLAELDLTLRGPGEVYGVKQHGFNDLKIASFADIPLVKTTRAVAEKLLESSQNLAKYPALSKRISTLMQKRIEPN